MSCNTQVYPPLTKNYSAPNIIGVNVEEPQMRDCKRSIQTQKICLADNKYRLKSPVSLAVNEMQGFSTVKLTVILKDRDTPMKHLLL